MYILHIDTFKYNTNAPHSLTLLYLKIMHSWAPRTVRSAAPAPGTPYPQTEIYFDAHQVIDKYETFNGHLAKDLLLHKHRTCFIPGLPRERGRRIPRPRNRGSSHRIAPRRCPGVQFNRHFELRAQNLARNWATFWAKFSTRAPQV